MTDPTPPTWCCMTRPTGEDAMSDETEWVLVPRDATPEMWEAGMNCHSPDDTQGDYLEKAWSAMLAAAQQPPAEAQPVACSKCGVRQPFQHSPDCGRTPPSASVGVGVGDKDCLTTRARELLADEYRKRGIGTGLVNDAGTATSVAIAAIAAALSQQPAAPSASVGVEGLPERWRREAPQAKVDSGEDAACAYREAVYWCAFQLEAALTQQPAAVDEAMLRDAERYRALVASGKFAPSFNSGWALATGTYRATKDELDAAADALAAQQGGSDNDR